jgi:hypothetical protein
MRSRMTAWIFALFLGFAAVAAPGKARADEKKESLLDRARRLAEGLKGKVVDWGKAAIDWTKKKIADSRVLRSLYGWVRGNPVIQWIGRKGEQIVRRLEASASSMVGRAAVTPDVPPFLQRLEQWRKQAAGGR